MLGQESRRGIVSWGAPRGAVGMRRKSWRPGQRGRCQVHDRQDATRCIAKLSSRDGDASRLMSGAKRSLGWHFADCKSKGGGCMICRVVSVREKRGLSAGCRGLHKGGTKVQDIRGVDKSYKGKASEQVNGVGHHGQNWR